MTLCSTGYASTIADIFKESIYLVVSMDGEEDPAIKWNEDGVMFVRGPTEGHIVIFVGNESPLSLPVCVFQLLHTDDCVFYIYRFFLLIEWVPIRACFRYVTVRPWTKFPMYSRTVGKMTGLNDIADELMLIGYY